MESKLFANIVCEQSIIKISEGDYSALSVLYDCVGRLIFSIAYSILNDYQLSEDVMQDTFLKIAEHASMYTPGTNAKAWIAQVCRNTALNVLDKRKHEFSQEYLDCKSDNDSVEEKIIISMSLKEAMKILSDQEREIVIYKAMWGLKHKEIAQVMNIPADNVRQKHKRALEKLKIYYKNQEEI